MRQSVLVPATLLFAGSGALLGGAYAFQYLGGLYPCVLCLYQRVPHAIVLLLALLAMMTAGRPGVALWFILMAGIAVLTGAGIAGFHVGVEQRWWEGSAECGSVTAADSIAELRRQLLDQPIIRCDEPAWSLFGISMAGYNLVISLSIAMVACLAARNISRNRSRR